MSHKCNSCEKEFDTYESMKQHGDAAHGSGQPQTTNQQHKTLRIPWYVPVLIVIVIAIAAFVILRPETSSSPGASGASTEPSVPTGQAANYWTEQYPFGTDPKFHWHAYPTFKLCGEDKTMLQVMALAGLSFPPSGMIGPENMHVHQGEPWFHMESPPLTRKVLTLANGFKSINIPFSNSGILTYTGANGCNNNQTNSLKVSVNGKPVEDPVNYVMRDKDQILIEYS